MNDQIGGRSSTALLLTGDQVAVSNGMRQKGCLHLKGRVKKNLNLLKAFPYVWLELTLGLVVSVLVYLVYEVAEEALFSIPNLLPGVLAAALAIQCPLRPLG